MRQTKIHLKNKTKNCYCLNPRNIRNQQNKTNTNQKFEGGRKRRRSRRRKRRRRRRNNNNNNKENIKGKKLLRRFFKLACFFSSAGGYRPTAEVHDLVRFNVRTV